MNTQPVKPPAEPGGLTTLLPELAATMLAAAVRNLSAEGLTGTWTDDWRFPAYRNWKGGCARPRPLNVGGWRNLPEEYVRKKHSPDKGWPTSKFPKPGQAWPPTLTAYQCVRCGTVGWADRRNGKPDCLGSVVTAGHEVGCSDVDFDFVRWHKPAARKGGVK